MYGSAKKIIIWIAFMIIGNVFSEIPMASTDSDSDQHEIIMTEEEVITVARTEALAVRINLESCDMRIVKKDDQLIVEFYPKQLYDGRVQTGGGGAFYFRKVNSGYKWVRGERWQ
jgi:hypothetical protein